MPNGRRRSQTDPGSPDTWPGLLWRLAERGGPVFRRGLLLLLVLILLVALEIAGLMGDGVVTSVVIHVR